MRIIHNTTHLIHREADDAKGIHTQQTVFGPATEAECDAEIERLSLIVPARLMPVITPVPASIANWRCKAILKLEGLYDTVNDLIAALPEPTKTVVLTAWEGDAEVLRDSPFVATLGPQLNRTEAQIDAMFIAADALNV